jgi:murein L,D-transpeptidase YafK
MKKIIFIFFIFFGIIFLTIAQDFKESQLKYQRVRTAQKEKESSLKKLFEEKQLLYPSEVFIRVFKEEKELELWVKNTNKEWQLFKSYEICSMSGEVGPKRQQGDYQVPEGFYVLDTFNPWSSYFLSMRVNYPNDSDRKISTAKNLGGDIMLHGACASIGCIAITDDFIKEVYWLAVLAKNKGQNTIPIHIFPCKMDEKRYSQLKKDYTEKANLISFWDNLKEGFSYFETHKKLPIVKVDKTGKYLFE